MLDPQLFRIAPGTPVDLRTIDTREVRGFEGGKKEGRKAHALLNERLEVLQEILYAQGSRRVLVVLQANTLNRSNIVAACSLQGIVDLARDGRVDRSEAEDALETALRSDRKALAARARRLKTALLKP